MAQVEYLAPGTLPPSDRDHVLLKRNSAGKWEGSGWKAIIGRSERESGVKPYVPANIQQDFDSALTDATTWADLNDVAVIYIQDQPDA